MIRGYSLGLMDAEVPKLSERREELGSDAYFLKREADSGESMSSRKVSRLRCWMPLITVLGLAVSSSKLRANSSRTSRALLTLMWRRERSAGV